MKRLRYTKFCSDIYPNRVRSICMKVEWGLWTDSLFAPPFLARINREGADPGHGRRRVALEGGWHLLWLQSFDHVTKFGDWTSRWRNYVFWFSSFDSLDHVQLLYHEYSVVDNGWEGITFRHLFSISIIIFNKHAHRECSYIFYDVQFDLSRLLMTPFVLRENFKLRQVSLNFQNIFSGTSTRTPNES